MIWCTYLERECAIRWNENVVLITPLTTSQDAGDEDKKFRMIFGEKFLKRISRHRGLQQLPSFSLRFGEIRTLVVTRPFIKCAIHFFGFSKDRRRILHELSKILLY